jgi:hypothetical protein
MIIGLFLTFVFVKNRLKGSFFNYKGEEKMVAGTGIEPALPEGVGI